MGEKSFFWYITIFWGRQHLGENDVIYEQPPTYYLTIYVLPLHRPKQLHHLLVKFLVRSKGTFVFKLYNCIFLKMVFNFKYCSLKEQPKSLMVKILVWAEYTYSIKQVRIGCIYKGWRFKNSLVGKLCFVTLKYVYLLLKRYYLMAHSSFPQPFLWKNKDFTSISYRIFATKYNKLPLISTGAIMAPDHILHFVPFLLKIKCYQHFFTFPNYYLRTF